MSIKSILEAQKKALLPDKERTKEIDKEVRWFVSELNRETKKIKGKVFVGGSYAKGTLISKELCDVDVFVRFSSGVKNLSDTLERAVKIVCNKNKLQYERLHGSRDYFQVRFSERVYFEVIPVREIRKPKEAENVTDLSYFHVEYVRKRGKHLEKETMLAKSFCAAQEVYGAESYIGGFSGYALECLIIYYRSFERMLKEMSKVKEQIFIDPSKMYKTKQDAIVEINEAKTKGPVILVDPTFKERNALAALSWETFSKFQVAAKKFLERPNLSYFERKEKDILSMEKRAKAKKGTLIAVHISTDAQEGDKAGTKLKKFFGFLAKEAEDYFEVKEKHFVYEGTKEGMCLFILSSKKEIIHYGPPIKMKEAVKAFKKAHKNTKFMKGRIIAKTAVKIHPELFFRAYNHNRIAASMGIRGVNVL